MFSNKPNWIIRTIYQVSGKSVEKYAVKPLFCVCACAKHFFGNFWYTPFMVPLFTHIHQVIWKFIGKQRSNGRFKRFKCRKILPNFEQRYDVIKGLNQNSISYNTCKNQLCIIPNQKNCSIFKNVYSNRSSILEIFVKM